MARIITKELASGEASPPDVKKQAKEFLDEIKDMEKEVKSGGGKTDGQ